MSKKSTDPVRTSKNIKPLDYKNVELSDAEKQFHQDQLPLLRSWRDNRDKARKEWNMMRYPDWIEMCRDTHLAYVPPAEKEDELRLNSGLTRQKISTEVDVVMTQNFDATAKAFDKDDVFIDHLGDTFSDMKFKSDELEKWSDNRRAVYEGMSVFGSFYTLEIQKFVTDHNKTKVSITQLGKMDAKWNETPKRSKPTFETLTLEPTMVMFADMRVSDIQKQPGVAFARIISDAEGQTRYGHWDRWKDVPTRQHTSQNSELTDIFTTYRNDYSVSSSLSEGEIEEVWVMRSLPFGNELTIYLNGVPMLPIQVKGEKDQRTGRYDVSAFPLTSVSASGLYPIVKWDKMRIPNFAIARGTPGDAQFDQETLDVWVKLMFEKALRSNKPPMGNRSGMRITSDMMKSGNMVSGIRKDDIFTILPPELTQGVTSGEFSFYEAMKKELDEKTSTREFSGQGGKTQTATEFTENRKSQLLRFSALIDGVIRGEKDRADLRTKNSIIPFWCKKEFANNPKDTQEINKAKGTMRDIFRTITVNKNDGDSQSSSVIEIGKSDESSFDLLSRQDKLEKEEGKKVSLTVFDPEMYDFMSTVLYWDVKPSERDDDTLKLLTFKQNISDAINLFQVNPSQNEKLKKRFAAITNEDYDTWFGSQGFDVQEAMGSAAQQVPNQSGLNSESFNPPAQQAVQASEDSGL
jgi:hypothetical protein